MTGLVERFGHAVGKSARSKKPSAAQALRSMVQAVAFAVIEVLALQHLDGLLWWAMLAIIVRNAYLAVFILIGMAVLSAEALRSRHADDVLAGEHPAWKCADPNCQRCREAGERLLAAVMGPNPSIEEQVAEAKTEWDELEHNVGWPAGVNQAARIALLEAQVAVLTHAFCDLLGLVDEQNGSGVDRSEAAEYSVFDLRRLGYRYAVDVEMHGEQPTFAWYSAEGRPEDET